MWFLQASPGLFGGAGLLLLLPLILIWLICLVAIANGKFQDNTTKICWFFMVLFLNVIGVLLFFFWGMKEVARKEKSF